MSIINIFNYKKKKTCQWCHCYNAELWTCAYSHQIDNAGFIPPNNKKCEFFKASIFKIKKSQRVKLNIKGKKISCVYLLREINRLESDVVAKHLLNEDSSLIEYDIKSLKQTIYYLEHLNDFDEL